jgi:hypothetical protein
MKQRDPRLDEADGAYRVQDWTLARALYSELVEGDPSPAGDLLVGLSDFIPGVGADAEGVVRHIAARGSHAQREPLKAVAQGLT